MKLKARRERAHRRARRCCVLPEPSNREARIESVPITTVDSTIRGAENRAERRRLMGRTR
jgi:hypothetical protein